MPIRISFDKGVRRFHAEGWDDTRSSVHLSPTAGTSFRDGSARALRLERGIVATRGA